MTNHLTPAAIDKAAKQHRVNVSIVRSDLSASYAVSDFGDGCNHVLSHLPDYAIGFHRWCRENRYEIYFGNDGPNLDKWYQQYSKTEGRIYYTDLELHAEYVKYLESNNK